MKEIRSKVSLQEACESPRALVFLWVNWAIQAHQSAVKLDKLLDRWRQAFPQHPIAVYRADLSDQEGDFWEAIRAWLETERQAVDSLIYGGNGALLWLSEGNILMHFPFLAQVEIPELVSLTRSVFKVE